MDDFVLLLKSSGPDVCSHAEVDLGALVLFLRLIVLLENRVRLINANLADLAMTTDGMRCPDPSGFRSTGRSTGSR